MVGVGKADEGDIGVSVELLKADIRIGVSRGGKTGVSEVKCLCRARGGECVIVLRRRKQPRGEGGNDFLIYKNRGDMQTDKWEL